MQELRRHSGRDGGSNLPPPGLLARTGATTHDEDPSPEYFEFDDVRIDFAAFLVTKGRHPLELTLTEFRLLEFLVSNRGRVLPRGEIFRSVWGERAVNADSRILDVYVAKLRRKIERDPSAPQ